MASKTHPTSLRLGFHKKHESLWTMKGPIGSLVAQDRGLRLQIEGYLKALQCIPGQCVIQRSAYGLQINVLYTKNTLFEDTRPKNRRKNRERSRLPLQNKVQNQIHAQGFSLNGKKMKVFWAHSLFTGTLSQKVLIHSGRFHRELASLLLLTQKTHTKNLQKKTFQTSAFYARVKILSALSCLSDAEQGRLSLGYRATQTALHPALANRKDSRLRRLVTPPSTLSATHLFGYGKVQQTAGFSLSTESLHLQGLLSLIKKGKGFGVQAYHQILSNRLQWIKKHRRPSSSSFFSPLKKEEKTGLEINFGSTWKGMNPQPTEKTNLLHHTVFFSENQKSMKTSPDQKDQKGSLSGFLTRPLGQVSGGPSLRMLVRALEAYTNQRVDLRFHKAKDLLAHPDLLARGIALALEHRVSFRAIGSRLGTLYARKSLPLSQKTSKVFLKGSDVLLSNRLLGLRVRMSGPLGKQGGGKKQSIVKKFGSTPLSTLGASIGYSQDMAYTKRGVVGVKVWIHTPSFQPSHQENFFGKILSHSMVPFPWTFLPSSHFVGKKGTSSR